MLIQMETDELLLNHTILSRGNCYYRSRPFGFFFESANNCNKNIEKFDKPRCRVSLKVEKEQYPAPGEIGCLSNIFKLIIESNYRESNLSNERMREKKLNGTLQYA